MINFGSPIQRKETDLTDDFMTKIKEAGIPVFLVPPVYATRTLHDDISVHEIRSKETYDLDYVIDQIITVKPLAVFVREVKKIEVTEHGKTEVKYLVRIDGISYEAP